MTQLEKLEQIEDANNIINRETALIAKYKFEIKESRCAVKHWNDVREFYQGLYQFVELHPECETEPPYMVAGKYHASKREKVAA